MPSSIYPRKLQSMSGKSANFAFTCMWKRKRIFFFCTSSFTFEFSFISFSFSFICLAQMKVLRWSFYRNNRTKNLKLEKENFFRILYTWKFDVLKNTISIMKYYCKVATTKMLWELFKCCYEKTATRRVEKWRRRRVHYRLFINVSKCFA